MASIMLIVSSRTSYAVCSAMLSSCRTERVPATFAKHNGRNGGLAELEFRACRLDSDLFVALMIIISATSHAPCAPESRTLQHILGIDPLRWNICRTEEGRFRNSLHWLLGHYQSIRIVSHLSWHRVSLSRTLPSWAPEITETSLHDRYLVMRCGKQNRSRTWQRWPPR
jgi:hypothetical protein